MATLSQLIGRVRFFIDEPTPQNYTDADITYALNVAQQDVAKEIVHTYEDYFEKQSVLNPGGNPPGTIPGVELYALPADFLKFKRIERGDTGETVPALDLNEKIINGTLLNILPIANLGLSFYVSGNNVGFTPTPTSVIPITMTYVYRLADMVNSSDVSDIPAEHHDMMAVRAALDAFIKDEGITQPLENRWNFLLDQLHRTLRQRQVQEPKRVRQVEDGSFGYGGFY